LKYFVFHPYTKERFSFEDIQIAEAKAAEFRNELFVKEEYRFTVAREIVNGNDTTWINANLDSDPEDSVYHVFNTFTGQHEKVESLTAARARKKELQNKFVQEAQIIPLLESYFKQPTSVGAQTL
jgi:hypothetical protein